MTQHACPCAALRENKWERPEGAPFDVQPSPPKNISEQTRRIEGNETKGHSVAIKIALAAQTDKAMEKGNGEGHTRGDQAT